MEPLVEIKNLSIRFPEGNSTFEAVKGISFSIGKGEIVGVVGESGSGKSMSALALMGLLPKDAEIASGSLCFQGEDLVTMKPEKRRQLCGSKMAMVFQEPMTSLNPVLKIERQVGESLRIHTKLGNAEIHERVVQALSEVGLPDPEGLCGKYPHELSGGMRQRVMIAQAMINSPSLLIADEPTTALDCVVQAQILELLRNIHRTKGTSILFISHDLNVVRALCSRVIVVYKGEIVEEGQTEDVLLHPKHEYTRHLVASIPEGEKGESSGGEILRLTDLNVFYDVRGGLFRKKGKKHVIHDLNLSAREGEIVGIVGESGCGKSTLSKTILGLHDNYTGEVKVRDGVRPQMVFQDPAGSLNPARTIGWILEEPLRLRGIRDRTERRQLVKEMLENVGLDESFAARHPRELSGGQKQRISIGVALLMDPRLVIADEPVSALDVTVQSQILNLLLKLHAEKQMTILFISHDLNVVRGLCSRVMVIYKGVIVEEGLAEEIYEHPAHPYTKLLLEAAIGGDTMELDAEAGKQSAEKCIFYERCPKRREACAHVPLSPEAVQLSRTHWARCIQIGII
ncbi:ABC transporter ATP-binding protein [Clostridium fessum]|uniref:dipeptide ABC transporter ATP-binding protein n=1 Tax=Clostridium fessum TaxID=2126740 RepID=UPI0022E767CC|nr:ABC transporter ATP-binding protein [Clostridium fessum]